MCKRDILVEAGGSGVEQTGMKRWMDIGGAVCGLLLFAPLLLLIPVFIRFEGRGGILFRQRRAIAPGSPVFAMYKFRSMRRGMADCCRREVCRTTRVGKILRRFSLDELLQLVNVLKGEMSLVGPRPLSLEDLKILEVVPEFRSLFEVRKQATPGMTGLWQVSGRRELSFAEMLHLDVEYVHQRSLRFDVWILLRTIPAVLFGRGAY